MIHPSRRIVLLVFCSGLLLAMPASGQTSFPIRRSAPYKVGDRWRTDIRVVKETKGKALVGGKERKVNARETTRLKAVVTILQVVGGKLVAEQKTSRQGRLNTKTVAYSPFLIATQAKRASRRSRYYVGQLDEFALWIRALSAKEISQVFAKGKNGVSLFR